MSNELQIVDESTISVEVKAEINEDIDRIISAHKNNRQAINKLVFESIAAMTEADDAQAELSNKGFFKRLIGGITGSNSRLQNRINSSRAEAMYASQQTLQKLAEQNLMTFDLIAAVNNKLNASMTKVDEELANLYGGLTKFFKASRSELARLEARVEKMERNISLLNWQNSIEYQEFEGVEYADLDDVSKIVCLVRDFYDITKGEWSNSDLLLLKSAMRDIDIQPKSNINYFEVLKGISYNAKLKEYMLDGRTIEQIDDPSYLLSLGCLKKYEVLNDEESYMVDTVMEQMDSMGVSVQRNVICDQMAAKYLATKAFVNVNVDVESYDLILDLLYNIRQAKDENLLIGNNFDELDTKNNDAAKINENEEMEVLHEQNENTSLEILDEDAKEICYGSCVCIDDELLIDASNNVIDIGTESIYEKLKINIVEQFIIEGKAVFKNCEIVFNYDGNIAMLTKGSSSEIYFENCTFKTKKKVKNHVMLLEGKCSFKNCLFSNLKYRYGEYSGFIGLQGKKDEEIYLIFEDCSFVDNEGTFIRISDWDYHGQGIKVGIVKCRIENHTGNFMFNREIRKGNVSFENTFFKDAMPYADEDDWDFRTQNYLALICLDDTNLECRECEFQNIKENIFEMRAFFTRENYGAKIENCKFTSCKQDKNILGIIKDSKFENMEHIIFGDTYERKNASVEISNTVFKEFNGGISIECGKITDCQFVDSTIRVVVTGRRYAYDSVASNLLFDNCIAKEVSSSGTYNGTSFLQALSYLDEEGICTYFVDCKFKNCNTSGSYIKTSAKALGWFDRIKTIYVGSERGTVIE